MNNKERTERKREQEREREGANTGTSTAVVATQSRVQHLSPVLWCTTCALCMAGVWSGAHRLLKLDTQHSKPGKNKTGPSEVRTRDLCLTRTAHLPLSYGTMPVDLAGKQQTSGKGTARDQSLTQRQLIPGSVQVVPCVPLVLLVMSVVQVLGQRILPQRGSATCTRRLRTKIQASPLRTSGSYKPVNILLNACCRDHVIMQCTGICHAVQTHQTHFASVQRADVRAVC